MYVDPERRGHRASPPAILRALEDDARVARLDPAGARDRNDQQPDAMRFYEREGYTRDPALRLLRRRRLSRSASRRCCDSTTTLEAS